MRPSPYRLVALHAILAALMAPIAPRAISAEPAASCPGKIPASAFVPGAVPKGWTGFVPRQLFLTGAGMMAGAPEGLEYLVPNKESRRMQVFDFQKGDRQRWLWCVYAGGLQLSRRLDDQVTKCTINTTGKIADATLKATVTCK